MKVYVYYNLHRGCLSVKALEGQGRGHVCAHVDALVLMDVEFRVSAAERERVRRTRRKNVHAGVVGTWMVGADPVVHDVHGWRVVTYNPYTMETFCLLGTTVSIYTASSCVIMGKTVLIP